MSLSLLIVRLVLAAVLGVAGVAKLADPAGSRDAARGFGVPAWLIWPAAVLVPICELLTAVVLLPSRSARLGAIAAAALLVAFSAAIAWALARGRRPSCGCFGRLHSAPAGLGTLARNLGLASGAVLVAVTGPGPALGDDAASTAIALLTLSTAILALTLFALLRRHGHLLARLDALEENAASEPEDEVLPIGARAPEFRLPAASGASVALEDLRAVGLPVLLVFADPACGPCATLLPEVSRWQSEHARRVTVALVSRGAADTNRALAQEHGIAPLLLQADGELADLYGSNGTPSAILIGADGRIAGRLRYGADGVRALLAQALEQSPLPSAVEFELPTATGDVLRSDDLRGRRSVLLFWSPDAETCDALQDRVLAAEAARREDDATLVVVSHGTADVNRLFGFSSPVVLDDGFRLAGRLGVTGTPSAMVLDSELRLASPIAAGGDAVLALLGGGEGVNGNRTLTVAASTAVVAGALAATGQAANADHDRRQLEEIKQALKRTNPRLVRRARAVSQGTRTGLRATDTQAAKFKLLGEIALYKQELQRAGDEIRAIRIGFDRGRNHNHAWAAKSHLLRAFANLDLMLDRFASIVRSNRPDEIERLGDEGLKLALKAWRARTDANRQLGCKGKGC
jgi:peroxiredoxin/uncharacterized membrane protein YphA (DoxX/SURF4 family)